MFINKMHDIRIVHNYGEPEWDQSYKTGYVTVKTCQDCGKKSQPTLHLPENDGTSSGSLRLGDLTRNGAEYRHEQVQSDWLELARSFGKITAPFVARLARLIDGTKYSSVDDLLEDMKNQCRVQINAREVPFVVVERWVKDTRKFKRKRLLAWKQGLVCNRCHAVKSSPEELTMDEIDPRSRGGQVVLENLQLLCPECNSRKGDSEPTAKDISPFAYDGPACVHRITCGDYAKLRAASKETSEKRRLARFRFSGAN